MIPLEVDEVLAMGQFMVQAKRKGMALWKAFWLGGDVEGEGEDERTPPLVRLSEHPKEVLLASIWGMSFPWTLVVSVGLGLGLAFVPSLFGVTGGAADALHVCGLLILTMATLAMGEPLRAIRYINVPLGVVAAAAPWFLQGGAGPGAIVGGLLGVTVAILAFPQGHVTERYGLWERFVV
jgi:hypothetical protein